jgi:hypothetical protein
MQCAVILVAILRSRLSVGYVELWIVTRGLHRDARDLESQEAKDASEASIQ